MILISGTVNLTLLPRTKAGSAMALPFELIRDGPDSPERVSLVPCFKTAFPLIHRWFRNVGGAEDGPVRRERLHVL
jgi:hypothetical protein